MMTQKEQQFYDSFISKDRQEEIRVVAIAYAQQVNDIIDEAIRLYGYNPDDKDWCEKNLISFDTSDGYTHILAFYGTTHCIRIVSYEDVCPQVILNNPSHQIKHW